jgi:hypothetical protein
MLLKTSGSPSTAMTPVTPAGRRPCRAMLRSEADVLTRLLGDV